MQKNDKINIVSWLKKSLQKLSTKALYLNIKQAIWYNKPRANITFFLDSDFTK